MEIIVGQLRLTCDCHPIPAGLAYGQSYRSCTPASIGGATYSDFQWAMTVGPGSSFKYWSGSCRLRLSCATHRMWGGPQRNCNILPCCCACIHGLAPGRCVCWQGGQLKVPGGRCMGADDVGRQHPPAYLTATSHTSGTAGGCSPAAGWCCLGRSTARRHSTSTHLCNRGGERGP
jgi:hypothetical protein